MFYLMQWLVSGAFDLAAQSRQRAKSRMPRDMDNQSVNLWSRQQQRLKEAIARARQQNPPVQPVDLDDEWVNPWTRQQRRFKEAIARARQQNSPIRESNSES
jgi:hypothetical protein